MGKIVIFDDNTEDAELLKNKLKYYLGDEKIYTKNKFDHDFLNENTIDLLFLDIELKDSNGIAESKVLKFMQKRKINIIFVSNHDSYLHDSMSVRPIYFIRKGNLEKDLKSAFNILMINNFRTTRKLLDSTLVNMWELIYVESNKHYLFYHFEDGKILKERAKLDECERELVSNNFLRCHKSRIVNLFYVDVKINNIFVLKNGLSIQISRKYYEEVTKKWNEYKVSVR